MCNSKSEIYYVVYCHTNLKNQKKYVGWAKSSSKIVQTPEKVMTRRWISHNRSVRKGSKCYFHNAIRKYCKEEDWSHEVIEVHHDLKMTKEREIYWIKQLKTYAYDHDSLGYNETRGGDGFVKSDKNSYERLWTLEKRKEQGEYLKRNNPMHCKDIVDLQRINLSKAIKGVKKSDAHRENIRKSKLGKNNPSAIKIDLCILVKKFLNEGKTIKKIAELTGVGSTVIKKIRDGIHWSCKLDLHHSDVS